jgi:hypothetical protein
MRILNDCIWLLDSCELISLNLLMMISIHELNSLTYTRLGLHLRYFLYDFFSSVCLYDFIE